MGIDGLPLETLSQHPVGIVAVRSAAIGELEDHAFEETRVGEGERLPILENIPPVALVGIDRGSIRLADLNGEDVPGAAGIAMPAAEGQGQVFPGQPLQIGILAGGKAGQPIRALQRFG